MVYKDLDLRRTTTRERVRRYRANVTPKAVTPVKTQVVTPNVRPVEQSQVYVSSMAAEMMAEPVDRTSLVRPERDERTYANAVLCEPVSSGCRDCKELSYRVGVGMSCPRGKVSTSIQSVFEAEVNPDHDCAEVA